MMVCDPAVRSAAAAPVGVQAAVDAVAPGATGTELHRVIPVVVSLNVTDPVGRTAEDAPVGGFTVAVKVVAWFTVGALGEVNTNEATAWAWVTVTESEPDGEGAV